ncbi:MAG TPA: regulatory iron-sulfur-containing complex subunit RicT [Gemmatimonadaceae bacterium]|nr:regulatory iron-sulfur-containing complex subunit RicT [Gemmatimonadaceae bacterium]
MSALLEVSFKGNRREFFLWDGDAAPAVGAAVVVEVDRGEDLGRIHATGELATKRFAGVPHGAIVGQASRKVLRVAGADEIKREAELRAEDEIARRKAMERVRAHGLVMKLTDAEWQWDRKKLTIYFSAEKRVDFRALVRELATMFRTRIELKQIGVRDEAKRLDGIGRCGRQYCSASWLPELRPVNLGVAKDQKLSLNPSQISGSCGRLMCCLRYEHEFYVQSRKRFPKEGKIIVTARGEEKIVANDIFNDRVTLRDPNGETRIIALAELRREMGGDAETLSPAAGGDPFVVPAEQHDVALDAAVSGADIRPETEGDVAVAMGESVQGGDTPVQRDRRPHRRRGRRGGRRGRETRGPDDGGSPKGGADSSDDGSSTQGN